jgi:hypothetical protein
VPKEEEYKMIAIQEPKESRVLAVTQGQEVILRMQNDIGILFELSTLLTARDVNILAINGAVCGKTCLVRLLADDHQKAKDVLAENLFTPEEDTVVLVELSHRPGMLKQVAKALAQEGLDIRHVYAAATRKQDTCLLVFHCSNDEEALARLKAMESE